MGRSYDGTTPFMIDCQEGDCLATALSAMYQVDQTLEAGFEWFSVTPRKLRKLKQGASPLYQHCAAGGLLLRPLSQVGRHLVQKRKDDLTSRVLAD